MPREASSDGSVSHGQLHRTSKSASASAHVTMSRKEQTDRSNRQRCKEEAESDANFDHSDMTILRTLLDGRHGRGMSYEEVFDSLDGVNRHTSEQWIRYFLRKIKTIKLYPHSDSGAPTNSDRVSSLSAQGLSISQTSEAALVGGREPASVASGSMGRIYPPPSHARTPSSARDLSSSSETEDNDVEHELIPDEVIDLDSENSGHSNANSRVLRSPSPPKTTCKYGDHRYRFTDEDYEFCIKMGQHMTRQNPDISLQDIFQRISEKAPHHSMRSWRVKTSAQQGVLQQMRNITPQPEAPSSHRRSQPPSERRPDTQNPVDGKPKVVHNHEHHLSHAGDVWRRAYYATRTTASDTQVASQPVSSQGGERKAFNNGTNKKTTPQHTFRKPGGNTAPDPSSSGSLQGPVKRKEPDSGFDSRKERDGRR